MYATTSFVHEVQHSVLTRVSHTSLYAGSMLQRCDRKLINSRRMWTVTGAFGMWIAYFGKVTCHIWQHVLCCRPDQTACEILATEETWVQRQG